MLNFKSFVSALFVFSALAGSALAQEPNKEYLLIYNGESFEKILTQPGDPGSFSEPCQIIRKRELSQDCSAQGFLSRKRIPELIEKSDLTQEILENSGVNLQNTTGFQVVALPPDNFSEIYDLATGGSESQQTQNQPEQEEEQTASVEEDVQSQPEQEEAESRDRPEMIEDKYLAQIPSPEKIRHLGGWENEGKRKPTLLIFIAKNGDVTYYQTLEVNPRLVTAKATGRPPNRMDLIRMSEIDHANFGSYAIIQER